MLYTVESLALRWGRGSRDVLRLGTDAREGLSFVVAVSNGPTVTMLDPGNREVDRMRDPLYTPEFRNKSGLFHVPAEAIAAILSTGKAELSKAIPGDWAHVREILVVELQSATLSLVMFRPPLALTESSLLVAGEALAAFEAAHPEITKATPQEVGGGIPGGSDTGAAQFAPVPPTEKAQQKRERRLQQWLDDQGIPDDRRHPLEMLTLRGIYNALADFPEFRSDHGAGLPIEFSTFKDRFWQDQEIAKLPNRNDKGGNSA